MKPRKYHFNNSTLTIIFGNIIESKAEVIVSSDDSEISMSGGVSRCILQNGGEDIQIDAQRKLPTQLGDVVVSTAGDLLCQKFIFHCITLLYGQTLAVSTGDLQYSEETQTYIIKHSVNKCFNLLHALDINSIAFPCIGAGTARFSLERVAAVMADAISDNLSKTQKEFNVELYLYDHKSRLNEIDYIDIFEHFAIKSAFAQQNSLENIKMQSIEHPEISKGKVVIPSREEMNHKVFISYARKDGDRVALIRNILDENSIPYWIDETGIFSGEDYKEVIVDAIDATEVVIFVSSAASNASINVIRELGYAAKQRKTIIPILLDDTQYAKSIRMDITNADQLEFNDPDLIKNKLAASINMFLERKRNATNK